jgi:putative transposase
MGKRKPRMGTLWEVTDELWARIEPLLDELDAPKRRGRKRVDRRRVLDGIIFRLRTGCQWNHLPSVYGEDSTIHRCFTRWCRLGVFAQIGALLVEECQELKGVHWEWQAVDTAMGKARLGGAQSAPTPPIGRKTAQNAAS